MNNINDGATDFFSYKFVVYSNVVVVFFAHGARNACIHFGNYEFCGICECVCEC